MEPNEALTVEQSRDETGAQAMARRLLDSRVRNALAASAFADMALGPEVEKPGLGDYVDHLKVIAEKAEKGDLTIASRMLVSQAVTLDNMFSEFARLAALNMNQYFGAAERFARLALKAQANSRATMEAFARLHQPREQTVRHVNVGEGGQAVVADHIHHHAGGQENGKTDKQSHATGAAGDSTAMLGHDPQGNGVPIPGGKREAAMQDARRDQSGSAKG